MAWAQGDMGSYGDLETQTGQTTGLSDSQWPDPGLTSVTPSSNRELNTAQHRLV